MNFRVLLMPCACSSARSLYSFLSWYIWATAKEWIGVVFNSLHWQWVLFSAFPEHGYFPSCHGIGSCLIGLSIIYYLLGDLSCSSWELIGIRCMWVIGRECDICSCRHYGLITAGMGFAYVLFLANRQALLYLCGCSCAYCYRWLWRLFFLRPWLCLCLLYYYCTIAYYLLIPEISHGIVDIGI